MTDDLKLLPPPEKKVAAKVLVEQGYSTRTIEEWLSMDNVSVWRASQDVTPDDLKRFETEFKTGIEHMKKQGIAMGYRRLLELIPKERRIDQLVKGIDKLEGVNSTQVLQQFNVGGEMNLEFIK